MSDDGDDDILEPGRLESRRLVLGQLRAMSISIKELQVETRAAQREHVSDTSKALRELSSQLTDLRLDMVALKTQMKLGSAIMTLAGGTVGALLTQLMHAK